jgi:hypothetical protein
VLVADGAGGEQGLQLTQDGVEAHDLVHDERRVAIDLSEAG